LHLQLALQRSLAEGLLALLQLLHCRSLQLPEGRIRQSPEGRLRVLQLVLLLLAWLLHQLLESLQQQGRQLELLRALLQGLRLQGSQLLQGMLSPLGL
jgi:hypothetical protein